VCGRLVILPPQGRDPSKGKLQKPSAAAKNKSPRYFHQKSKLRVNNDFSKRQEKKEGRGVKNLLRCERRGAGGRRGGRMGGRQRFGQNMEGVAEVVRYGGE